VGVRLRNPNDVFLTLTAEITSLVPGTLVVEAHRRTGMLYLHVLDLEASGGPDGVRASTLGLEAQVLRAFATDADLERLGLGETQPVDRPDGSEVR
jgi:multicomponent Na+:H+ antiporter subunit E